MTSTCASLQRIARLTPLADVLSRIEALVQPVAPSAVTPAAAVGRVLAADLTLAAHPAAALALRDGCAITSDLAIDASAYAPVPLQGAAAIAVGEQLPDGADAVATYDLIDARFDPVNILGAICAGDNVLPAGGDIDAGGLLLKQGRRLTLLQGAVLAAAAHGDVPVRAPRIRVAAATDDAIIHAAVDVVARAIEGMGGRVQAAEPAKDALVAALTDEGCDGVIAIGGTGCGANDASVCLLARRGRVEVHGIALAPGETTALGMIEQRPVLLLPGRIDAALAAFLVVGRAIMRRLAASDEQDPTTEAVLTRKVTSGLGLSELVPVRVKDGRVEPIASGYLSWTALAQADGWLLIAAESEGFPAGTRVMIRAWP
ncbi:MAG: molybdopterin-binding protein [Hyphomicrobiales bacterium]|nr:molybdopterin-binding protein [Hyphomicrobiales bacterium]